MASERSGNPDVNGGQVRPPWRCSPDVPRRSRGGGVVLPSGRARRYTAQVAEAGSTRVLDLRLPSPVEELHDDVLARHAITLYLKRDDRSTRRSRGTSGGSSSTTSRRPGTLGMTRC